MAVRRPLKLDSNNNIVEMTASEVNQIVDEVVRLYGDDPSVTLSVDQGNGQNTTIISETRYQASALASGGSPWPTPASTSSLTVQYNNTVAQSPGDFVNYVSSNFGGTSPKRQTASAGVYSNYSYPLYRTSAGHIQPMTQGDFFDTLVTPAIDRLVSATTTQEDNAGTYFVSTSTSESNATLVSSTAIAQDTVADTAAFASGSLPETQDQPTTVTSFYLHRVDALSSVSYFAPLCLKINTSDFIISPKSVFRAMAGDAVKYVAVNGDNNKAIRYDYYLSTDTSFGVARGTGITDTNVTGETTRYEQPNATTYYAQNVPSGTATVNKTYFLRIGTQ